METHPELGNNYSEVIAAQDVATYGGLCALASFDRAELKAITKCLPYNYDLIVFGNYNWAFPFAGQGHRQH